MQRVLITDPLSKAGLKILQDTPGLEIDDRGGQKMSAEQLREAVSQADGVIVRSGYKLTPEILKDQPRLKVIVRAGVGVDNIDLPAATREGVVVMNTPAGNTTSTAEHTLAMMMALSRNIAPACAVLKGGKWDRKSFTGTQLAGKVLGVVGLGRIGLSVARRCVALEMKVLGYDPFLSPERAAEQGIELYRDLDEMIVKCDYITVHTPMTPETEGLLNAARIATLKPGVRIINCARGGIVNESRNLVRTATAFLSEEPEMLREIQVWTMTFSWAVMARLRSIHLPELLPTSLAAELPPDVAQRVMTARHVPLAIAMRITELLEKARADGRIDSYRLGLIDQNVQQLVDYLGGCERIHSTPLPYPYTVHLRRALICYCFTLPLALAPRFGWSSIPAVLILCYVLFGIEEIGVEIEDPFGKDINDLPLERICQSIEQHLRAVMAPAPHGGVGPAL